MTTARELYTEARRLREFARTLDEDSEVWAAVQELIVELSVVRASFMMEMVGTRASSTHRRSLAELTIDELRGRARAYRDMAETATTTDTEAALIRAAEGLDRMVATRMGETLDFPPMLKLV
jgi:aminopeptidase C